MPGPRAVQNLQMPHPRDWQGVQMPRSSPGGPGRRWNWLMHNWREIVLMQGDCHKNCNYDYINRLAFRIFFHSVLFKSKASDVLYSLPTYVKIFFSHLSSVLIEEFCSCYTEPHRSLTCQRASQNTKHYHSWTTNRAKLWMICALLALRPISHITKKTLSYLHSTKIEQMTKTMVDDGNF